VQESFVPSQPKSQGFPSWAYKADYRTVQPDNVRDALEQIVHCDLVSWDSEYKATSAGHLVSAFSFSTRHETGWLLPVAMEFVPNLELDVIRRFLYAIARKENTVQAAGAEMRSVRALFPDQYDDLCRINHDIQVIWYQRDPNEAKDFKEARPKGQRGQPQGFSLDAMALKYLKLEIPSLKVYFSNGGSFAELDPDTARVYAGSDADSTRRLHVKGFTPEFRTSTAYQIDMAALPVLRGMEDVGIWFDKERLSEIEIAARKQVTDTKSKAYRLLDLDSQINIDSNQKLSHHLYNVLGWPVPTRKPGKNGFYTVKAQVIQRFAESADKNVALPAQAVLDYRKWHTLHNNFLTKLDQYVNPHTGAIHCSLLATVVPTGRLACASPNLQQIPKYSKVPLRRAFRARPGYLLVEADYSQIELRVYAGETQEQYYFNSFLDGTDLHLKTASIIYREPITSKKDERRQMGKVMNFGPIYGMKPEGLAQRTDYDIYEAERILDDFFSAQPDAVRWTRECHAKAKQLGGVHTKFGRWRPLPWLNSRFAWEIEFGERSAVNTIVQGTAADIMKIGLVRLARGLAKPDCPFDARLILTVHDSYLLEVREGTDLIAFIAFLEDRLCFKIDGYPPLEIDADVGRNWYDMEPIKPDTVEPAAEAVNTEPKRVPIPANLNDGQRTQLVSIAANSQVGEVPVLFVYPDGKQLTPDPIMMTGLDYQRLLQFLVSAARSVPHDSNGNSSGAHVPRVNFA
jgi:DNA polymerase I-like protein with 3'-5' exonuclease and polymerase domains